jgi:tRNA (cytidine56-2'-O)-methyltransferase
MNPAGLPHIGVLRLGHRRDRDKRITSHLGLTARAFGANEIHLSGEMDSSALETWNSVTKRFGGSFKCRYEEKPLRFLRRFSKAKGAESGTIVHLTMYGEPWKEALPKINLDKPMIIVVGGTKVPGEVYRLADHNISVGNQPHSEVAALAIFLDSLVGPIDDLSYFQDGEIRVIPNGSRKQVITFEEE